MKFTVLALAALAACTVFSAETPEVKELVCNGDFTRMHPKNNNQILAWNIKKGKAVREGEKVCIQLEKGGTLGQHLRDWKNSPGQVDKPRTITVRFTAYGKGRAVLYMARYTDRVERGERLRKYHGADRIKVFNLNDKAQVFETDYLIPANEWASLGLNSPEGEMTVENVSITLK